MKLLLVDDEHKLLDALGHILKKNGYSVDTADDGNSGMEMALSGIYDIIILDWMLPGQSGPSILHEIRSMGLNVPIIFLTARDALEDRVAIFYSGADDYLIKPFATAELLARIRALTRRRAKDLGENTLTVGNVTLNPMRCEFCCNDVVTRLTFKETQLLELLMLNSGQVITKERILSKVWGYSTDVDIANVDLYVHYLRKKINSLSIRTVRGIGYCLQETVDVS